MELSTGHQPTRIVITFSEALEKTGFGLFNYFLIFIGGLVLTNVYLETLSVSFVLPVSECDLNLTNVDKGILSAIGQVSIIISSQLWGFLADTKGRRAVIRPTLLICFVITFVSSFSHHFWMLALLRFINGFFVSGASATIYAYVGEFHIDRTRTRALMGSSFIFAINAIIFPLIAWGVINQSWSLPMSFLGIVYKPWRLFIAVCGIPGVLAGLALLFYPESPKFLLSIGKESEAIEILRKMHKWNCGSGELKIDGIIPDKDIVPRNLTESSHKNQNFTAAFLKTMWEQTAPLFDSEFLRTTLLICTMQFWVYVTYLGMYAWFPYITENVVEFTNNSTGSESLICNVVYARQAEVYQTNGTIYCTEKLEDSTYVYSMVLEIMCTVGFVIVGIIATKVRKLLIIFVVFAICGSCEVISIHVEQSTIALSLFTISFVCALGTAVLNAATIELYPTHLRGMAICISLMFGRVGGILGMNIVGLLLNDYCEMTFYISGIALIACGFMAFLMPQELKVKDCDDCKNENPMTSNKNQLTIVSE